MSRGLRACTHWSLEVAQDVLFAFSAASKDVLSCVCQPPQLHPRSCLEQYLHLIVKVNSVLAPCTDSTSCFGGKRLSVRAYFEQVCDALLDLILHNKYHPTVVYVYGITRSFSTALPLCRELAQAAGSSANALAQPSVPAAR